MVARLCLPVHRFRVSKKHYSIWVTRILYCGRSSSTPPQDADRGAGGDGGAAGGDDGGAARGGGTRSRARGTSVSRARGSGEPGRAEGGSEPAAPGEELDEVAAEDVSGLGGAFL
jgi:hypothetical protein